MRKILSIIVLGLLWSNIFISFSTAEFNPQNIKEKYIFSNCKNEKGFTGISYILNLSKKIVIEKSENGTIAFSTIDFLDKNNGRVYVKEFMTNLTKGPDKDKVIQHMNSINIEISIVNIKTGEWEYLFSWKESAPSELKEFKLPYTKFKCEVN